jgi:hypothetical protein
MRFEQHSRTVGLLRYKPTLTFGDCSDDNILMSEVSGGISFGNTIQRMKVLSGDCVRDSL